MTARDDGVLLLVEAENLVRVEKDGSIQVVANGLQERRFRSFFRYDRHALMGLGMDPAGNVFIADYLDRVVKLVDPRGRIPVAARSRPGWGPSGGMVAPDGALWILEFSVANTARVRRIAADGTKQYYP